MLLVVWLFEVPRGLWVERYVVPERLAVEKDGIVKISSVCQRPVGMSNGEN